VGIVFAAMLSTLFWLPVASAQVPDSAVLVVVENDSSGDAVRRSVPAASGMASPQAIMQFHDQLEQAFQQDFGGSEARVAAAVQAVAPAAAQSWIDLPSFSARSYRGSKAEMTAVANRINNDPSLNGQVRVIQFFKEQYNDDHRERLPSTQAIASTAAEWGIQRIKADQVWNSSTGSGVIVAVIDTGVDANHPRFRAGQVIMDGSNNFVNRGQLPNDNQVTFGHGTHVAGIIAGQNGIGVAPNARILAVKVFDSDRFGIAPDFFAAVDRSIEQGAQVINMSFGEPITLPSGQEKVDLIQRWTDTIDAATRRGIICVAATGNVPGDPRWGAERGNVLVPGVVPSAISVAASTKNNSPASGSRPLPGVNARKNPDVAAPGGNWNGGVDEFIISAKAGGRGQQELVGAAGTSMAAPHVSGVCALLLEDAATANAPLTPARIKQIFSQTTLAGTKQDRLGNGVIDALAAYNESQRGGHVTDSPDSRPLEPVITDLEKILADVRGINSHTGRATLHPSGVELSLNSIAGSLAINNFLKNEELYNVTEQRAAEAAKELATLDAAYEKKDAELRPAETIVANTKKSHAADLAAHRAKLSELRVKTSDATAVVADINKLDGEEKAALKKLNDSSKALAKALNVEKAINRALNDLDEERSKLGGMLKSLQYRQDVIQGRLTVPRQIVVPTGVQEQPEYLYNQ